ncbi:hypothetical protein BKA69DRAFT_1122510 [Paraphysoderma sedebokerense]|nr:hypothetical protein BKA69DRAFT_1122510 [Paraphysoderma sedebokerense]
MAALRLCSLQLRSISSQAGNIRKSAFFTPNYTHIYKSPRHLFNLFQNAIQHGYISDAWYLYSKLKRTNRLSQIQKPTFALLASSLWDEYVALVRQFDNPDPSVKGTLRKREEPIIVSRSKLVQCFADYYQTYGSKFSREDYSNYFSVQTLDHDLSVDTILHLNDILHRLHRANNSTSDSEKRLTNDNLQSSSPPPTELQSYIPSELFDSLYSSCLRLFSTNFITPTDRQLCIEKLSNPLTDILQSSLSQFDTLNSSTLNFTPSTYTTLFKLYTHPFLLFSYARRLQNESPPSHNIDTHLQLPDHYVHSLSLLKKSLYTIHPQYLPSKFSLPSRHAYELAEEQPVLASNRRSKDKQDDVVRSNESLRSRNIVSDATRIDSGLLSTVDFVLRLRQSGNAPAHTHETLRLFHV